MPIHQVDQLNEIPFELSDANEDKYESYIRAHSIFNLLLTYFFILIFLILCLFIIYFIIVLYSESNTIILEQSHDNFPNQTISFNFTKIQMKHANIKIDIKFYTLHQIENVDLLFAASTSPAKTFFSYSTINSLKLINDFSNNNYIYSLRILDKEITEIKYVHIETFYPHSISHISQVFCSVNLIHHHRYYLSSLSRLYITLIFCILFIVKTNRLISLKAFEFNNIIPVAFILFNIVAYFPFDFFGDHYILLEKILEICLITTFYMVSLSFLYFSYNFLPFRLCETIFDIFISVLNMIYCIGYQIFYAKSRYINPKWICILLLTLFVIRYLQKGYYWLLIGTDHSHQCGIVYTIINIITTIILFLVDLDIFKANEYISTFAKMIALTSYTMMLSLLNTPKAK